MYHLWNHWANACLGWFAQRCWLQTISAERKRAITWRGWDRPMLFARVGQLFDVPLSRHERTDSDAVWRALAQAVQPTESVSSNRFISLQAEQRTK